MSWVKATMLSVFSVFLPIKPVLITVGVLIFADLIFGLAAAHKQQHQITSAALRRTVTKSVVYLSAVMLGYICEHFLLGDLVAVSKIIAGTIGLVEMKSILENADIINGGSLFKAIVAKLGSENDKLQELPKKDEEKPKEEVKEEVK